MQYAPTAPGTTILVTNPKEIGAPVCIVCTKHVTGPLVICSECLDTWAAWLVASAPDDAGRRWQRKVTKFYLSQYGPSAPCREREATRMIKSALHRAAERMPNAHRVSIWRQILVVLAWGVGVVACSVLFLSIIVTFGILAVRLALLV
jgi:hypothetical protein